MVQGVDAFEAADALSVLLRGDAELARLSKRILRQQGRLRSKVSDEAWRVYLRLEVLVNERQVELLSRMFEVAQRRARIGQGKKRRRKRRVPARQPR